YDEGGRLTGVVDPHGLTTSYHYDVNGARLTEVDTPDGASTLLHYDNAGLLDSVLEPGNRLVGVSHTGTDLSTVTDAAGFPRVFAYDGSHHLTGDVWGPPQTAYLYAANTGVLEVVDQGLGATLAVHAAATAGLEGPPTALLTQPRAVL